VAAALGAEQLPQRVVAVDGAAPAAVVDAGGADHVGGRLSADAGPPDGLVDEPVEQVVAAGLFELLAEAAAALAAERVATDLDLGAVVL